MSERFLKYETEAENGMVDERGVLIPGGMPSGGSAGVYKYFGVSIGSGISGGTMYKMKDMNTVENPSNTANGSDVTLDEFLDVYYSHPIMLIPIDKTTGTVITGDDRYAKQFCAPKPVVSYMVYGGVGKVTIGNGDDVYGQRFDFAE